MPHRGDTVIGHDVWIGYHAYAMLSVSVGRGAIVASGSVVANGAPGCGIVDGNPARLIRRRYTDEDIERLLTLAWWDWPVERFSAHVRLLMTRSIDEFERIAPTPQ